MLNISKNSISKLFAFMFVAILLPVGLWYFFKLPKKTTQDKKHSITSATATFIENLENRYSSGDFEGLWKPDSRLCSDIPFGSAEINSNILRCNPVFLSCIFKKELKHINPIFNVGEFTFNVPIKSMSSTKRGGIKFKVNEQKTNKSFWLKFENTCRSVKLPENKYLSTFNKDEPWDSHNRKIHIDKHYISNWDVERRYKNNFTYKSLEELKPSTKVTIDEKKQFCKQEGGKLLAAHIFEAATMFPVAEYLTKASIPKFSWGKMKKSEMKLGEGLCTKMYVKGCSNYLPKKLFQENGVSWIGIYNALGGEIESLDNFFSKGVVYKMSSKYFPKESKWHDTRVKSTKLINFPRKRGEKIGAAFRCMFLD